MEIENFFGGIIAEILFLRRVFTEINGSNKIVFFGKSFNADKLKLE